MRFFDYCRKYIEYVDDHPRSIEEFNKFINGGHISNIRKKIQSKYQIQHLTNKQVRSRATYICKNVNVDAKYFIR